MICANDKVTSKLLRVRAVREQGMVLLMALILMAVLAVSSAVAVRLSMNTDQVAANMRSRQLAFEAAEVALRWCEADLMAYLEELRNPKEDPPGSGRYAPPRPYKMLMADNSEAEWTDEAKWTSHGISVATSALKMNHTVKHQPQCLIRHFTLDEWRTVNPPTPGSVSVESRGFDARHFLFYRITARGYSPDYQKISNANDPMEARGSEARVQTLIRTIQ